jgi:hypothetical protein
MPPSPSSAKASSPTAGNGTPPVRKTRSATIERSPVTPPAAPSPTNGVGPTLTKIGHEHPPDSPYLEFAKPSSPPSSPPMKAQPVVRKVTSPSSPSKSRTKTDDASILRPTRSSSLAAPAPRTSRSPSPTPSMIHRPESASAEVPSRKTRTTSNPRRTVVALPANPPPAPDHDTADSIYGSVTLGSHSETNLLNPSQKGKSGFSAVVHRKVTENVQFLPPSDARSVRSVPNMTLHARRAVRQEAWMPPGSPGHGDLAALLAEAALLEERLKQGETSSDISDEVERGDTAVIHNQPASAPYREHSKAMYNKEIHDQVPPPPPPKGFRMFSNLKKLTSSGTRSTHGFHSRVSTSGSELSSSDSASVGTPSDSGIPFPGSQSNGSLDRPSSRGSYALGFGYLPTSSSKKSSGSMNKASTFADKIWHRSRTKSNNSNAGMSPHHCV